jgi:hypothetical protein
MWTWWMDAPSALSGLGTRPIINRTSSYHVMWAPCTVLRGTIVEMDHHLLSSFIFIHFHLLVEMDHHLLSTLISIHFHLLEYWMIIENWFQLSYCLFVWLFVFIESDFWKLFLKYFNAHLILEKSVNKKK